MGTYLNPGKIAFEEALNSEIFIDKSEMISYLNSVVNTSQRYVSVFRPRRFGKSMAADMISAYYDKEADSRALFEKCAIGRAEKGKNTLTWDEYLGKFNVVRLVMTDFFNRKRTVDEAIDTIKCRILDELAERYPDTKYDEKDFPYSIDRFYRKSETQFVIVIDEWDAVFREDKDEKRKRDHTVLRERQPSGDYPQGRVDCGPAGIRQDRRLYASPRPYPLWVRK